MMEAVVGLKMLSFFTASARRVKLSEIGRYTRAIYTPRGRTTLSSAGDASVPRLSSFSNSNSVGGGGLAVGDRDLLRSASCDPRDDERDDLLDTPSESYATIKSISSSQHPPSSFSPTSTTPIRAGTTCYFRPQKTQNGSRKYTSCGTKMWPDATTVRAENQADGCC